MTGRNAREVARTLDILRQQGDLITGVKLNKGGSLRVALSDRNTLKTLPLELSGDVADNAILAVGMQSKQNCQCPVVVVSKDTNLRIKADALGLNAEDYETDKVDVDELYTGTTEVLVDAEQISKFFKTGSVTLDREFLPNQDITLVDSLNPSHTALGMANGKSSEIVPLIALPKLGVSRIQPRNREQRFALNLLLQDSIKLVTLVGKAGTGKTLLAIAAGLQKVADEKFYSRLLISRPVVPMGKDIGFLPGDVNEKLTPWMQPLYDNFDLIFGTQETQEKPGHLAQGTRRINRNGSATNRTPNLYSRSYYPQSVFNYRRSTKLDSP